MEKKTEQTSQSVFAVNATEAETRAQVLQRNEQKQAPQNNEKPLSVSQASSEALKILENQGFGRTINAAAQSLLANGFLSASSPLVADPALATNTTEAVTKKAFAGGSALSKAAFSGTPLTTKIRTVGSQSAASPASATDATQPHEQMPLIGDYMDYRRFLLDFYSFRREQTKKQLRPYSYSTFAAAANIKSPNYLKMIIEGKRNLSEDMIGRFAKATGLNKADSDQFRMLVQFNQSADPSARNLMLKDISDLRVERQLKAGEIDRKAWDRLPSWVAWVVYALMDQEGVDFKIESLRDVLRGKAKPDEIEAALKSLIDSGEILFDEVTGAYSKSKNRNETPEDIPVALIRKLQAQLMLLGLESLYQDSPTEREFGTLTVALTQSEFEELRFKLRQMRKQIHKDISSQRMQTPGERVYQLNLQLFPVTDKVTT